MNSDLAKKLVCECVGTMGLTLTVIMVNGAAPGATVFAAGIYLACFAYAFGSISGTHVNPAVSTGVFVWGFISGTASKIEFPLYVLVQYVGAFIGGAIGGIVRDTLSQNAVMGIAPFVPLNMGVAFGAEFFAVFFFVLVILRVACSKANAGNPCAGLVIGLALTFNLLLCGSYSGGGMNPAVVAGVAIQNILTNQIVAGEIAAHFVAYYLGPIVGALAAVGMHVALENNTEESDI